MPSGEPYNPTLTIFASELSDLKMKTATTAIVKNEAMELEEVTVLEIQSIHLIQEWSKQVDSAANGC
jgi:hypothetical protein